MTPNIGPLGHQQTFQVGTFDIDHQKQLTLPALVRFMQEAAMQNVIRLKLSVWDLELQQLAWVLTRQQLQLHRLPMLGESFTVYTQPIGFERIFTVRDFYVFDARQQAIASSSTTWLLMNTHTRSMSRIPPNILDYQKQIPENIEPLPEAVSKLPSIDSPDRQLPFHVNWYDLDFNRHLNNTNYIKWMLEATPLQVLENQQLKQVDLLFRAEAQINAQIEAQSQIVDRQTFLHRLVRIDDGKELASARTVWGD